VEIQLGPQCAASDVHIEKGHPLLDGEVLAAVKQWRFALCSGQPQTIEASFDFQLVDDATSYDPNTDWAPTQVEMRSPYNFTIRTRSRPYGWLAMNQADSARR
jgi:hypothetical protein